MCHLSWSHNPTLLNTFLRRRTTLRLWSRYLQEKTHRKLNSIHRMTTTTMTMRRRRMRKKKKATRMKINITTPPEFKVKRVLCPGREEYKAIVEILSGPNVLSCHQGLAFRDTH
jgi:hypothetical protein